MVIGWGKPNIWISKLEGGSPTTWIKVNTPVENTTTLTTTKGDKKEAKIEGGENEAVKYNRNTYLIEFEIRQGNDDGTPRKKPVEDEDGVIAGEYAFKLQPEDPTVEGVVFDRAVLSCEDTWNAEDGGRWKYSVDALKPSTGNTLKWAVVTDPTNA